MRKQRREIWFKRAVAVAVDDIGSQHTVVFYTKHTALCSQVTTHGSTLVWNFTTQDMDDKNFAVSDFTADCAAADTQCKVTSQVTTPSHQSPSF